MIVAILVVLACVQVIGMLATIASVGKPREPVSSRLAVYVATVSMLTVLLLTYVALSV